MSRLFETIRIDNGEPSDLRLHENRLNLSRRNLFGSTGKITLADHIHVPDNCRSGIYRCRVIYEETIVSVEFIPYLPAAVRTLKVVHSDEISYSLKYLDRTCLTGLIDREVADDVLIVKKGCVTDTSYSNIVFTDGRRWITPDTPLLRGTMREKLLSEGAIIEERITPADLNRFTHFRLINAMLGFNAPFLPIKNIVR
ncbi:MAG: aminotransferase class IV [Bacteroidales bacterium]|jgi:4-amino-4-deoxychorismate lyase|nr:aminotransferase class IV [Bacteroidales bacterium]